MVEATKRVIPLVSIKKHSFYNDNGIEFIAMTKNVQIENKVLRFQMHFYLVLFWRIRYGRNEAIC
jgi:hypothetical protein